MLDPALVEQTNPRLSGGISELLAEAERMQRCGSWRIQHDSGEVLWSPETYRLLNVDPNLPASLELLLEQVHPEDRDLLAASVRQSWLSGRPFRLEHRLQLANDQIVQVLHRGETICDDNGKALYTVSTLQRLSQQRNLQLELEQATHTDAITGQRRGARLHKSTASTVVSCARGTSPRR